MWPRDQDAPPERMWGPIMALAQAVPRVQERARLHEEERPVVTRRPPANAMSRGPRLGGHACYRAAAARVGGGKLFEAWWTAGPIPMSCSFASRNRRPAERAAS